MFVREVIMEGIQARLDWYREYSEELKIVYIGNSKEIREYKLKDLMPHYPRR